MFRASVAYKCSFVLKQVKTSTIFPTGGLIANKSIKMKTLKTENIIARPMKDMRSYVMKFPYSFLCY